MLPEIFRIPGLNLPIHGYGLMIVVGFLSSTWMGTREARRRGLPDFVYDLAFVMLLSGILGGRLFYYVENYRKEFSHRSILAFFEIWKGGLVFYGGGILGTAGSLAYLLKKKYPLGECLDAVAPFVLVGMGFGRIGCLLNGCCYGRPCGEGFPLGIIYPSINNPASETPNSPAFLDQLRTGIVTESDPFAIPVYPTQLFEAGYDFIACAALAWYLRGQVPRAIGFPLIFMVYGIGRFCLEFLRGDNPATPTSLTISQNVSLGLVAISGGLFILLYRKGLKGPEGILRKIYKKPLTNPTK